MWSLFKIFLVVSIALAQLSAQSTQATVYDFEGLPESQPVANQIKGLAFSNATILRSTGSLNELEFPPSSGKQVACDVGGPLSVTFAQPVTFVLGFYTHRQALNITAYDASGNIVVTQSSSRQDNRLGFGFPPNEAISVTWPLGIGKITVQGALEGSSFTLDDLTLGPPPAPSEPPTFTVDVGNLSFDYAIGMPAPSSRSITVTASPDTPFSVTSTAPWLRINSSGGKTPATLSVSIATANLTPGSYGALLLFTGSKAAQTGSLFVVLHVLEAPKLFTVPATMSFTHRKGDPAPAAQQVYVGAFNSNLSYIVMPKDAWVRATPDAATTGLLEQHLLVAIDPTNLAPGHYQSAILIAADFATNSPLSVPIVVDVTASSAAAAEGNQRGDR